MEVDQAAPLVLGDLGERHLDVFGEGTAGHPGLGGLEAESAPGSPHHPGPVSLVPVSQVGYVDSVTLIWNCSVVDTEKAFTVYYSSAAGQGSVVELRNSGWTSRRLFCDTVFTVVVDVVGPTGAPLTAAMSTTVAVQDPDLVATSLTAGSAKITGAAALAGTTTTGTLLAGDVTASSLTSACALGVLWADGAGRGGHERGERQRAAHRQRRGHTDRRSRRGGRAGHHARPRRDRRWRPHVGGRRGGGREGSSWRAVSSSPLREAGTPSPPRT
ncbi:hypothetical protein ABT158_27405 [Nonomuraea sp. NPDC001636]|uniref:hypothetical protein n=1 Tax=Nonomuraea sp. NPDC001636 TaxID=3154391 RepID=UPI00332D1442